ncbi:MAG: hypothetical protein DMF18_03180 [Verrucomicrobia bacterium]|nr:MAG: hypothetical protein DMF18_03180 [Verrucomicrobiota bacterium]
MSASPTQGSAPLTVSFNGSGSTDADGSVVSYTFSFGDGSADVTQSSPTIQHTYNNAGDYFATLTVKDNTGASSSNIASVEIKAIAAPDLIVSALTASNNQARQGDKVTFTATIKNQGQASAAASKTEFLLDGATVLGLIDTPALAPGGSATVTVNWLTASAKKGQHTIKATADKTNVVAESNDYARFGVTSRPAALFFLQLEAAEQRKNEEVGQDVDDQSGKDHQTETLRRRKIR